MELVDNHTDFIYYYIVQCNILETTMTQYFEKWSEVVNGIQKKAQEIAELNVKTIQSFKYLKPEELSQIKKPEELLEKQINLAVENGHKTLDYMQQYFQIIEKTMGNVVQASKKAAASAVNDNK